MNKLLFTATLLLTFLIATPALAQVDTDTGCQPIFNGGVTCQESNQLSINKKILNPTVTVEPGQSFHDKDFIENVGPNDTRYTANKATAFRLYVTNKTNATLKNIEVKDIFPPSYLTFVSGNGEWDNASRTFSTTLAELKAKETKAITIQVLTARTDQLPTDNAALCTINIGTATVNKKASQDTSQLCVSRDSQMEALSQSLQSQDGTATPSNPSLSKGGLPVVSPITPQSGQKTPDTGPEMLALIGLVPAGLTGMALRRKTQ